MAVRVAAMAALLAKAARVEHTELCLVDRVRHTELSLPMREAAVLVAALALLESTANRGLHQVWPRPEFLGGVGKAARGIVAQAPAMELANLRLRELPKDRLVHGAGGVRRRVGLGAVEGWRGLRRRRVGHVLYL